MQVGSNDQVTVAISIDTEEDNWATYAEDGATTENIAHLRDLQDVFDRHGARPTYLVNRPPLLDSHSVEVLAELAAHPAVEVGAHCHPWNTPPFDNDGPGRSMMCQHSTEQNLAKLREIRRCLGEALGVEPRVFRAGRWGLGPTVARALHEDGYRIDCSVSPFMDWSYDSGPDYRTAPHTPYRFHPDAPLRPDPAGSMLQLPTTIGYLAGHAPARARARSRLVASPLRHFKVVGILDRLGLLAERWLSPETSTGPDMVRLVDNCVATGQTFLQMTFHSCTLLPGATPFVCSEQDRTDFLGAIDQVLAHCARAGFTFRTLSEAAAELESGSQESTART